MSFKIRYRKRPNCYEEDCDCRSRLTIYNLNDDIINNQNVLDLENLDTFFSENSKELERLDLFINKSVELNEELFNFISSKLRRFIDNAVLPDLFIYRTNLVNINNYRAIDAENLIEKIRNSGIKFINNNIIFLRR